MTSNTFDIGTSTLQYGQETLGFPEESQWSFNVVAATYRAPEPAAVVAEF
jgi:hypothetical protein